MFPMDGAGLAAVTEAVAESLLGSGSGREKETRAELAIVVPSVTAQSTLATRVMVALAPPASLGKVTVRFRPLPPQIPPSVAAQETKAVVAGSGLWTTT